MLHSDIVEKRDLYCLSYILQSNQMFFQTGYKVLQSQEKNGFIRCTKIIFNGQDKLVYDVSKYKSLDTLLPAISPDAFISIMKNLLDVIIEVNNNGFMQYSNIEIGFDKVFVDNNNYKVYLIYLPINITGNSNDYTVFEKQLKNNIINAATSNPNILTPQLQGMLQIIKNDMTSIEVLKEKFAGINNMSSNKPVTGGLNTMSPVNSQNFQQPVYQQNQPAYQPQPVAPQMPQSKPEKKKHGGLFSKKDKSTKNQVPDTNIVIQPQCEGGATEILDEGLYNDITLIGVNTPQDFRYTISKPEFFIGKKADSVDACISFNNAVSRVHCKIITSNNEHFIVDLGSANGTYVNGYRLNVNQQMPIKQGDSIKLANSEFTIN